MSLGGCKSADDVVVFRSPVDQCEANGDEVSMLGKPVKLGVSKKQMVTIVALTAACTVIFVVVGTLVGVKFFLDASHDTIQRKFELTVDKAMKVEEELTVDLTDNTVQFHTLSKNSESWLLNDFNREIQILKSIAPTGSVCYVSALNRSVTSSPKVIKDAMQPMTGSVSSKTASYRITSAPITDKSVLGSSGQRLCADADTYWAQETCDQQHLIATAENGREKRATCTLILICKCCPERCVLVCVITS